MMEGLMMSETSLSKEFYFIGNCLCLDFVNTQVIQGGQLIDLLVNFGAFVSWLEQAQVLDASKAEEIVENWRDESESESAFERALDFRADLGQMIERVVRGKAVSQSVIVQTNEFLRHQVGYAELKRVKSGFKKHFRYDFKEPFHLLWPIAESVCDLLCYAD